MTPIITDQNDNFIRLDFTCLGREIPTVYLPPYANSETVRKINRLKDAQQLIRIFAGMFCQDEVLISSSVYAKSESMK